MASCYAYPVVDRDPMSIAVAGLLGSWYALPAPDAVSQLFTLLA